MKVLTVSEPRRLASCRRNGPIADRRIIESTIASAKTLFRNSAILLSDRPHRGCCLSAFSARVQTALRHNPFTGVQIRLDKLLPHRWTESGV